MKKLMFLATMMMATMVFGQSATEERLESFSFSNVEKVDGKTANDLYYQAKLWFTDTYKSVKDVIQFEDKENNTIVGKGTLIYNSKIFSGGDAISGTIDYTIRIMTKDGRYKYEFIDFIHKGNRQNSSFGIILNTENPPVNIGLEKWRKKVYKDIKEQIEKTIQPLEMSLKSVLAKEKPNEDW